MNEQLSTYLYYALLAVLVFNLTQRKHQKKAERKRMASLYAAGSILLFMAGSLGVVQFGLPAWWHIAAGALTLLYLYLLRDRIFIFPLSCADCNSRYSLHQILYEDSPSCGCRPRTVDDVDWSSWKPVEEAVLCFVVKEGRVLLIHKKTGLGKGKINAPGGRIEAGETPMEAAVRETAEETGLTPLNLEERVELSFIFTSGYSLHGRAFFASDCTGEMTDTPEADPFWCDLGEIPFDSMWEDDPLWIPRALEGEKLKGLFIFEDDSMLSHRIIETENN
jgi:8-oxo-dGTP diphosphatase